MKKVIFLQILTTMLFISCAQQREVTKIDHREKEKLMIENNKAFSNVSIVGGNGAYLINKAERIAKEKSQAELKEKLENIDGVTVSVNNSTIKASLSNDILFEFNSSDVSEIAKNTLEKFSKVILETDNKLKFNIIGHTDNIGTKEYNLVLSEKRANAVADVLIELGLKDNIIQTLGKGFSEPIAENSTPAGREKNRRVEILIIQ